MFTFEIYHCKYGNLTIRNFWFTRFARKSPSSTRSNLTFHFHMKTINCLPYVLHIHQGDRNAAKPGCLFWGFQVQGELVHEPPAQVFCLVKSVRPHPILPLIVKAASHPSLRTSTLATDFGSTWLLTRSTSSCRELSPGDERELDGQSGSVWQFLLLSHPEPPDTRDDEHGFGAREHIHLTACYRWVHDHCWFVIMAAVWAKRVRGDHSRQHSSAQGEQSPPALLARALWRNQT